MTTRPICIVRDGLLYLDKGFADYIETPEHMVRLFRWTLTEYPESHAERISQIDQALAQYEESQRETT